MKVTVSRSPYTTSTGATVGAQDRVSIIVEGEPCDSPETVANGFKLVEKTLKEETK